MGTIKVMMRMPRVGFDLTPDEPRNRRWQP
jgi:hypothetical protein